MTRGPRLGPLLELLPRPRHPPRRCAVPSAARPAYLAARRLSLPRTTPLVVVVETDEQAHRLADDLGAWMSDESVAVLPERGALPLERAHPERDESAARLAVLARLAEPERDLVVVATLAALWQRTLSVERLGATRRRLRVGDRVPQRDLVHGLVAAGYDPTPEVTGIGELAVRGGIVDLWPPGEPDPVRIEQFGDEVDALRIFEPTTQASRAKRKEILLLPAGEFVVPAPDDLAEALHKAVPDRGLLSDTLQTDLARLEAGDAGDAAETWIRFLTAGPALDHLAIGCHVVLTDVDQLQAHARDADQWATRPAFPPRGNGRAARRLAAPVRRHRRPATWRSRRPSLLEEGGALSPDRVRCRAGHARRDGPDGRLARRAGRRWAAGRGRHRPGQPSGGAAGGPGRRSSVLRTGSPRCPRPGRS